MTITGYDTDTSKSVSITGTLTVSDPLTIGEFTLPKTKGSAGQVLKWNGAAWAPADDDGLITVQEEGSSLSTAASTLNFVGSGVTATGSGATKTITITTPGLGTDYVD